MSEQVGIPSWAMGAAERQYPFWFGTARHYQFDGEKGLFLVGTEEAFDSLWVQPIYSQWSGGLRWGRPAQEWFDLAFVDATGHVVSQLSLKKQSAVNVQDYLIQLESGQLLGQSIHSEACWLHLVPQERETLEGETYWVVAVTEHNYATEEQYRAVLAFKQSRQFEWHFPGEVTPQHLLV